MAKKINLMHQVFGQLTVIGSTGKRAKNGAIFWSCKCSCGRLKAIGTTRLRSGTTITCGQGKCRGLNP